MTEQSAGELLMRAKNCIEKLVQCEADERDCQVLLGDLDAHLAQASEPISQGLCETTLTERFAIKSCECGTYPDNLGPCKTYLENANGRCTYCDHGPICHMKVLGQTPDESLNARQASERADGVMVDLPYEMDVNVLADAMQGTDSIQIKGHVYRVVPLRMCNAVNAALRAAPAASVSADARDALRLLLAEVVAAGLSDAKDYGWPIAVKAACDALGVTMRFNGLKVVLIDKDAAMEKK